PKRPGSGISALEEIREVRSRFAVQALLAVALQLFATGTTAVASAPSTASTDAVAAAAAANGAWTTYHHDNAHTGFDASQPNAAGATTGWTSPALNGNVYGEPLVYNGLVYVATLQNTVYALDQATGAIVWSSNLGAPQTSGWGCGNINPTGVLSTGVIDVAQSRIYVVGFLTQFLSYYLFGLDLATGTRVLTTQIAPNGFACRIHHHPAAPPLSTHATP